MRSATSARRSDRQRGQKRRRLRWIQVREHQRNGLRMLVVNELGQLLRIGFLQRVEAGGVVPEGFTDAVEQAAWHAPARRR